MNKKIVLLLLIFLVSLVYATESFDTDISLFQNISQSFENKYYPDTIEKVELLEKDYPNSVFMQSALVLKSKAQVKLGYYEDSIETLKKAINQMYTGKTEYTLCNYLLGKSYWYIEDYENAIKSFYRACTVSFVGEEQEYYDASIYYAADSYFKMEKYKECCALYEYVIEHGDVYTKEQYETSINNLLIAYEKSGNHKKITILYESLKDALSSSFFTLVLEKNIYVTAAKAYEAIGEYDTAFDIYKKVLSYNDNNVSLYALNKIYNLCIENKIDNDIKVILKDIEENTKDEDKYILDNFYVRLGINEYENKDYEKSYEYFSLMQNKENVVSDIYIAKMILDTDNSIDGAIKARTILEKYNDQNLESDEVINLSDTYYSLLLQCSMQSNEMESIPLLYSKIEKPTDREKFINSYYYYKKRMYDKVESDTGLIYASALCHMQNYTEGVIEYEKLEKKEKLNDNALMEYGKALFILKEYDKAYETVAKSHCLENQYVMGLCKLSLKEYDKALVHFMNYIKSASNVDAFYPLAFYYKGFIEYSLGEYKNANASFIRFLNETKDNVKKYEKYINSSYTYATVAALETNDNDNAVFYAGKVLEKANEKAQSYEQRIDAVRFYFKVLTDTKNYDMAIQLLEPYSKSGDFAPEALFYIGRTFEEKNDVENALKSYNSLRIRFSQTEYAEEAFYRCGELYYINQDYFMAYKEFNDYVYKYPNGKFIDSALFFSGDSAFRLGEINKAIMINKNMISKYPDSRYAYSASINLLRSYYEKEEYENALDLAIRIVDKFGEQAILDNVNIKVTELERIVSGISRNIAQKMSEYEIKGEKETKEGRIAGSELVQLYVADPYKYADAYLLAKELLERQTLEEEKTGDESETEYMAANAEVIADYYREINKSKSAADYYLLSAQYYRKCGNSLRAASTLYGAAEAFAVEGLLGDARQTADLLKKLYPNSKYAEKVDAIIR